MTYNIFTAKVNKDDVDAILALVVDGMSVERRYRANANWYHEVAFALNVLAARILGDYSFGASTSEFCGIQDGVEMSYERRWQVVGVDYDSDVETVKALRAKYRKLGERYHTVADAMRETRIRKLAALKGGDNDALIDGVFKAWGKQ